MIRRPDRPAASLTELTAAVAILGLVAAAAAPLAGRHISASKHAACEAQRREVELQVQLWRRTHGVLPRADLSDIAADADYFCDGLPECPADGSRYTIDAATGRVIGHNH